MAESTVTSHISARTGFRAEETKQLFQWAEAGESALIVGASGVGKSNLFNHLLDPGVQEQYLAESPADFLLIRVNFHDAPDQSARTVYSLILEQLELFAGPGRDLGLAEATVATIAEQHQAMLDAGADALKVRRHFRLALRSVLQQNRRHLVLLFDQFDDVYRDAPAHLFANLRGLREAYKYRISYFVFSRHYFRPAPEDEPQRQEFYELLGSNLLGLKPYDREDALAMLARLAARNGLPSDEQSAGQLVTLTGGHAGLLRAVYLIRASQPERLNMDLTRLLSHDSVYTQCDLLWHSLAAEETELLARFAHGLVRPEAAEAVWEMLQRKGIVVSGEIFSPLFAAYVADREMPEAKAIVLDRSTKRVLVHGKPSPRLTALEYRLFRILYEERGRIVNRDELLAAGWPDDDPAGISDSSLSAALYRLRRKINPAGEEFIETVPAHGWRLNTAPRPDGA